MITKPTKLAKPKNLMWGKHANRRLSGGDPVGEPVGEPHSQNRF